MPMKKEEMRPGLVVSYTDPEFHGSEVFEVFIIGQDPKGDWIGYCEDWVMKISELDDNDYEFMEPKE